MKSTLKSLAATFIMTGLGVAGPVLSTDLSSLVPIQVQGAVNYVTGGIGEDEAAAFKQAAPKYPLELLFVQQAPPRNEYLADVRVSIRNRSGTALLETTAAGPFLLAELPAGTYRIDTEYRGEPKHQTVVIRPGAHRRAIFVWAHRAEADEPVLGAAG